MSGLDNKDELIYCCKCGAPNRKEADFCRSCGETLDKDIPEAYNSNKVTKKQNENLPPPPPQKPPAQQQPQYYNNHQRLPERKNKGGLFKRKRSKIPVAIFITIGIVFLLMFIYFSVYDTVIIVDLSD